LISQLGIEPTKAVFVDDFLHNVEGARAAGLLAIHFQSADQALGELQALLQTE
jgi:FMN phosphatase YigB (HAD superfamily)